MKISIKPIIKKLNEEFPKVYKSHEGFVNSGYLWDKCIEPVKDLELLKHIIFCNDVLKVPFLVIN